MNQPAKRKARILVVDDDPGLLRLLTIRLRAEQYDVEAMENGVQALAAATRFRPDLVISDLRMDQLDGIGLLKELQNRWPGLKVILLTAHGTIPDAVQATQMGAFGFLTKPVEKQELLDQVQKALKISGFVDNDQDWRSDFMTRSPVMEEKLAQAHMVAGTDARVLITGESGTGKELLARAVHKASTRRNKPFVSINCSAMAENMLESELFGHAAGAFAGATSDHRGLFQTAEGGTLLLDEIGDMPMRLQVKLLRALQENLIRPVGSTQAIPANVRVISSTHSDLQQLMAGGQFREDLYYRLNVVHIEMPPLNKRREDIPVLVAHFLAAITQESGTRKIYAQIGRASCRERVY
jgi:two-component system, NtrC family, response regulator GlrR